MEPVSNDREITKLQEVEHFVTTDVAAFQASACGIGIGN